LSEAAKRSALLNYTQATGADPDSFYDLDPLEQIAYSKMTKKEVKDSGEENTDTTDTSTDNTDAAWNTDF